MNQRAKDLLRIVEMVRDADLNNLSRLSAKRQALVEARNTLAQRAQEMTELADSDYEYQRTVDNRWTQWATNEMLTLNREETDVAASIETQRALAKRSFGRAMAFAAVLEKTAKRRR